MNSVIPVVRIYTDGSCWPNPGGPGGWSAILVFEGGERRELFGKIEAPCTNNRAELKAAIEALRSLGDGAHAVDIFTDSRYLRDGAAVRIHNWSRRNWRGVKNSDLWKQISRLEFTHDIRWHWVPGHQNKGCLNDRADTLAEKARRL